MLTRALEDGNDPEVPVNMAILENEIDEATCKSSTNPAIHIMDAEKHNMTMHGSHTNRGSQD